MIRYRNGALTSEQNVFRFHFFLVRSFVRSFFPDSQSIFRLVPTYRVCVCVRAQVNLWHLSILWGFIPFVFFCQCSVVLLLLLLLLSFFILICIFIVSFSHPILPECISFFSSRIQHLSIFLLHIHIFFYFGRFVLGCASKRELKKKTARIRTQHRDRSRMLRVFIASKMNFSLRPGKKENFLRKNISLCFFSLKGKQQRFVLSQFFTLDLPQTHTLTHEQTREYPHPSQTALTCTPLNDHAEHSSDFIHFRFYSIFVLCVYLTLDKSCALHSAVAAAARDDYVILFGPQPISVVHFFGALLDFPRTKRRMQFGARKLATIHACTKRENSKINETPISNAVVRSSIPRIVCWWWLFIWQTNTLAPIYIQIDRQKNTGKSQQTENSKGNCGI